MLYFGDDFFLVLFLHLLYAKPEIIVCGKNFILQRDLLKLSSVNFSKDNI